MLEDVIRSQELEAKIAGGQEEVGKIKPFRLLDVWDA